ncbi:MAG: hypothetical protein MJZ26_06350 [Fibrobacter sp.]|nr:hypothetical protein [Fibrobacter sp.]
MKRKILGMFFLLSVVALVACSGSSTSSDDEDDICTKDPMAPGCVVDEPVDEPAAE